MTLNSVTAGRPAPARQPVSAFGANVKNAQMFKAMLRSHRENSAFAPSVEGIRNNAAARNASDAFKPVLRAFDNWRISDCYKLPANKIPAALEKIREEIKNADFSAMSDIKIYSWIESKFIDKFGEDFMMAHSLNLLDPETGDANFKSVGDTFNSIMDGLFSKKYKNSAGVNTFTEVNRMRLYGNMGSSAIMDAIRAKYPSNEKLTNRDVCLMLAEMNSVGVFSGGGMLSRYVSHIISVKDKDGEITHEPVGKERSDVWQGLLESRFRLGVMCGLNNESMREPGGNKNLQLLADKTFLIKYLGATVGLGGFLEPDELASYDWEVEFDLSGLIPELEDELMSDIKEHEQEMAEIREERERERLEKEWASLLDASNIPLPTVGQPAASAADISGEHA